METGDPAYAEFMPRVVVIVTWFQGELLRSGKVVSGRGRQSFTMNHQDIFVVMY